MKVERHNPNKSSVLNFFFITLALLCQSFGVKALTFPLSYYHHEVLTELDPILLPPQDNMAHQQKYFKLIDKVSNETVSTPFHFAEAIPHNIELNKKWHIIPSKSSAYAMDKAIWRFSVLSPGAASLSLGFSDFQLPQGVQLFIYSPKYTHVLGPYSQVDNDHHREFWSPILQGDTAVIEINAPLTEVENIQLHLKQVNHAFIDIFQPNIHQPSLPIDSTMGMCAQDFECRLETDSSIMPNSSAWFTINGTTLCAGTAVNNERQDGRPLFMTSSLCNISSSNAASVVAYWNNEKPSCQDNSTEAYAASSPTYSTQSGAKWLANSKAPSHVTLLEFDDPFPQDAHIFLAGWEFQPTTQLNNSRYALFPSPKLLSASALPPPHKNTSVNPIYNKTHIQPFYELLGSPMLSTSHQIMGTLQTITQTLCMSPIDETHHSIKSTGQFHSLTESQASANDSLVTWLAPLSNKLLSLDGMTATRYEFPPETRIEEESILKIDDKKSLVNLDNDYFHPQQINSTFTVLDVSNLNSDKHVKTTKSFYVFTPQGSKNLKIMSHEGQGDITLKVKYISPDYSVENMMTSGSEGTKQILWIKNPVPEGTYKVMISGKNYHQVSLTATYEIPNLEID